jgi:hypothetical protein
VEVVIPGALRLTAWPLIGVSFDQYSRKQGQIKYEVYIVSKWNHPAYFSFHFETVG